MSKQDEATTATFVRDLSNFTGTAKLYRLSRPVSYGWDDEDPDRPTTEYVAVSATVAMFSGPETYIFPADENGEVDAIELKKVNEFVGLMSFPVIRRSARAKTGGVTTSWAIRWEPKYYWRGIAVSSPKAVEEAIVEYNLQEAALTRKLNLGNDFNAWLGWLFLGSFIISI